MLKHKIMHTRNREAALSMLQEAIRNPDLGLSRNRLLHSMNELTGRPQMWPPLRAYISMHDVEGKAAQEAATTWAMAHFDEAQEGVIGEAEAKRESEQAQANANSFIGLRALALLKNGASSSTLRAVAKTSLTSMSDASVRAFRSKFDSSLLQRF